MVQASDFWKLHDRAHLWRLDWPDVRSSRVNSNTLRTPRLQADQAQAASACPNALQSIVGFLAEGHRQFLIDLTA
jgi:hypothetical protein